MIAQNKIDILAKEIEILHNKHNRICELLDIVPDLNIITDFTGNEIFASPSSNEICDHVEVDFGSSSSQCVIASPFRYVNNEKIYGTHRNIVVAQKTTDTLVIRHTSINSLRTDGYSNAIIQSIYEQLIAGVS